MLSVLGRWVFIEPIYDPNTTESGMLYIPETARERTDQGLVKYVGPRCRYLEPGMWVMFPGFAGSNYFGEEPDTHLIHVHETSVLTVFEGHEFNKVPGLYCKGKDGKLFEPGYEVIMNLVRDAFRKETLRIGKSKLRYGGSAEWKYETADEIKARVQADEEDEENS